jgi:hypothetical protein
VPHGQLGLEFIGLVEMIFDRALVATGDKDHFGNAGGNRFLDRILN